VSAVAPARVCAYAVLRRVFEDDAYADLALRSQARGLDTRDRALATRLAYGAVQRRGTLDHLIALLAERPAQRLDAPLLAALRLGLYELLYLEGAPDHAVVADAVELAKGGVGSGRQGTPGSTHGHRAERGRGLSGEPGQGSGLGRGSEPGRGSKRGRGSGGHGLVNAVLRRATREGRALLLGLDDETPEHAAIMHSHPPWIAQMWWDELGPVDARALLAFDNEPAELALRANTLRTDAATLAAELQANQEPPPAGGAEAVGDPTLAGVRRARGIRTDPFLPEALVVDGPLDVHGSPLWRSGAFIAQSRAAMLPARILDPQPGERVLDLCAAPGGKSTHLAALMENRGEVLAVEQSPRRAAELQHNARRLGADCVRVLLGDATRPLLERDEFDRVLVDPPCSGLGTLQARADLRWRATPERVLGLVEVQRAILRAAAGAVRPGGVLVYSTCTISPSENERQIIAFLESNPQFALDDLGSEPALGAASTGRWVGPPGAGGRAVLTLPHRDRTAGFFIARLRRA
jgi:16S rRNA (cytosine967-C5)-methyltransferase